jgi:hypothetical protein
MAARETGVSSSSLDRACSVCVRLDARRSALHGRDVRGLLAVDRSRERDVVTADARHAAGTLDEATQSGALGDADRSTANVGAPSQRA